MNLSLFLFLIGTLGFILNRKNIILMIISIEIMLLAVTVLILISSFAFDDNIGQIFSIYIISIAGAESVIGLSILVAYYRLCFSSIFFSSLSYSNNYFYKSKPNKRYLGIYSAFSRKYSSLNVPQANPADTSAIPALGISSPKIINLNVNSMKPVLNP